MAMQMRVTGNSIAARVLGNLQHNLNRVGDLQEQLSSGKQINRPSDSPTGTASAMQLRSEVRAVEQYARNANDGLGWLGLADQTLTTTLTQVNRVRDLTLQGVSGQTINSPDAREAIAIELDGIRESLISMSNTTYLDRPIFGGTTSGGLAYDKDGVYVGDAGKVNRTIGPDATVRVDVNGPEVFGTGDTQLFTVLANIAENLRAGDADALRSVNLDQLDTATSSIKTKLADLGARYNRVERMQTTAEDRLLTLTTQLSDIEDIDLPATIVQVQLQQTAYQAALAATAKVIQPSLIDFLR